MRLNALLTYRGIDPRDVSVVLHSPPEPAFRRLLPWLAETRADLFDNYQATHPAIQEKTVISRPLMLSFVRIDEARQLFVSLFRVEGWELWEAARFAAHPGYAELAERLGHGTREAFVTWCARLGGRLHIDLAADDRLADYQGRLAISQPAGRNYVRLADRLDPQIVALYEEPRLAAAPPKWREMVLTGSEVRSLPESWAAKLREWRGVYHILDSSDGARYVGAAYGVENILGRWRAHVAGERGVTKELAARDPSGFRFSILERVSPDMPADEVIALERSWMDRLQTVQYGLNT